jgi:hypothetical protein
MPQQQLTTNYDISQIFLNGNFYKYKTYTNSTGSTVTINPGRLLGTVLASDKVLPQISTAVDGSEMPVGVAAAQYVVLDGASATVCYCISGEINQSKIIFGGSEGLATVVRTVSTGGGTIGDLIVRNTDIKLVPTTELTITDPNQ